VCVAKFLRFFNASSFFIQIIGLAACLQKTAGFARKWPQARGYVIHSSSAFSKPNIHGPSAEYLEACFEDVDLLMLKKYNYDVKMAFYTPLVCLSLVL
jgi:hypothetical protein